MDWKEIGKTVGSVAPVLGTVLGGPVGAIAGAAGAMIAALCGDDVEPTPQAVNQALKANPELMLEIKVLEASYQNRLLDWQEKQINADLHKFKTVNQTMQIETKGEDSWTRRWRPYWGFMSANAFCIVAGLCCWIAFDAVKRGDPSALNMIPQMVTSFATLFGIPGAILGVASWHRGKMQRENGGSKNV